MGNGIIFNTDIHKRFPVLIYVCEGLRHSMIVYGVIP